MTTSPLQPQVLAIIPARGGSKGLPGKNIKPLLGKPLIAYSISIAAMLGENVTCVVSTDDADIAETARQFGGSVPFMRPDELAGDLAPSSVVLRHALETMESLTETQFDLVLLLEPTSPTRTVESIRAAIDSLQESPELDGVIAVSEAFFNPTWVGVKPQKTNENKLERYFSEGENVVRRQDVPRFLRINGNFYVWRAEFIRRLENSWFDEGVHGHVEIPETQAFSIDEEPEFRIIEAIVKAGIAPLPGYQVES
ncbi:cytidylyltransferase domain-containing protein [Psychromicrobium lacuslunae]|uniref:Acylneuraminate cytidylyltransferase n=1 Tax=Psychromicrobium lacuslunae TaxID=1618207 RepID=A0A0D4BZ40_9MICC|nr:acylneuraminate cytidylyltransferase family protein [Psychromicrobium lacuslunae]AJT41415.1 acylneuraminate cytidylyltransferase [Psychromicrobium lacuslunae]